MNAIFNPSNIHGTITAPPNKSLTHRYLVCAALADGCSTIKNILISDDTNATIGAIQELGAYVRLDGSTVYIRGTSGIVPKKDRMIDCNESGTTLRLIVPITLLSGGKSTFFCTKRLLDRVYESIDWIFNRNIDISTAVHSITVDGIIEDGAYEISSNTSQFISGLMIALALKSNTSAIHYNEFPAKQYIMMTEIAMKMFDVTVRRLNDRMILVGGTESLFGRYQAREITINECDWSNSAVFLALGAQIANFTDTKLIADANIKNILDVLNSGMMETIDVMQCPDLAPTLFAYAATHNGGIFKGCKKLEFKESDRRLAMKTELEKFGTSIAIMNDGDTLAIGCANKEPTEEINSHNDHRVVMAMSLLTSKYGGVIKDVECINKSYPRFFDDLKLVNADVTLKNN